MRNSKIILSTVIGAMSWAVVSLAQEPSASPAFEDEVFGGTTSAMLQTEVTSTDGSETELASDKKDSDTILNNRSWTFLGCTHDSHDCQDEAEAHGYHHYRARHDHHRCSGHHDPYACYGRN